MKKPKEVKKGTQYYKLLKALSRKKGMTSADAFKLCDVTSMHRRFTELREMGYCISDSWEYKYNENGKIEKRYKRYRLCA